MLAIRTFCLPLGYSQALARAGKRGCNLNIQRTFVLRAIHNTRSTHDVQGAFLRIFRVSLCLAVNPRCLLCHDAILSANFHKVIDNFRLVQQLLLSYNRVRSKWFLGARRLQPRLQHAGAKRAL